MRFSLDWVRQFVPLDLAPDALAARLTASGLEVSSCETRPDSDAILEIEVTANRPDVLSHFGLAREIAALFELPLKRPAFSLDEDPRPAAGAARVIIEATDLCPRYVGRVVTGLRVAESPPWLKRRLEAIGLAPKNNAVDASNYVLFELGQPLHAFDLARLRGRGVLVRRARAGERLVTVADREEKILGEDMLVIAEAGENGRDGKPAAIAGVMGGFDSAISDATTEILIESAWFEPQSVRRTARSLGLTTDASYRFERGADPAMTRFAADRLAALIAELAGGRVLAGALDVAAPGADPIFAIDHTPTAGDAPGFSPAPAAPGGSAAARSASRSSSAATSPTARSAAPPARSPSGPSRVLAVHRRATPIHLRSGRLAALLGLEASPAEIATLLERLGIEVLQEAAAPPSKRAAPTAPAGGATSGASAGPSPVLVCRVPTWRGDLSREVDLIEEYARTAGYDRIPDTLPAQSDPSPAGDEPADDAARRALVAFGYREAITYAMISPQEDLLFGALDVPHGSGSDPDDGGRGATAAPAPRATSHTRPPAKPDALGHHDGGTAEDEASRGRLVITNPLSDRWEVLRRSLMPGLARALAFNLARGRQDQRMFEVATIHARGASGEPQEHLGAAVGASGLGSDPSWPRSPRPFDILDLKGAIEGLAVALSHSRIEPTGTGTALDLRRLVFVPPGSDGPGTWPFHARQSFVVHLAGRPVGRGGRLRDDVAGLLEAERPLWIAEILLAPLAALRLAPLFQPLPRLNPVDRDLSFLVDRRTPFAEVEAAVRRAASSLTAHPAGPPAFTLIDRFEGGSLPPESVSFAFRFRFAQRERALTAAEINGAIEEVARRLVEDLHAEIRSR